jgi:energy-coupling factor transporter ATP-binding protein EcfA2
MKSSQEQHQGGIDPLILLLLALGGFLVLPCVCAALLARWLPRKLISQRLFWLVLAVFGVLNAGGFLLLAHPWNAVQEQLLMLASEIIREAKMTTWNVSRLWRDIWPFWADSLPFAPLATCLSHLLAPQNARERLLSAEAERTQALAAASKRAQRRAKRGVPDQIEQQIVLGLAIGTGFPAWVKKHCVIFPTNDLGQHGVVIGKSGSGKSTFLLRLAVLVVHVLHWQVIMIDGKGDEDAGAAFVAAMKHAGIQRVKLFPAEPYNGWVGTPRAILSRLLAIEEFSDTHYRAVAENLLRLALTAPGKPVQTSAELLARLNLTNEYLLGLYAGHAEEVAYLEYLGKKDPLGVFNRYAALLSTLGEQLAGSWSFDDTQSCYISLDGLALSGIISGLARYFVEDFAHYAGQRKPKERRVLFIFDDLGAVDANLTNMFERVRARGVSVFVSGQSDRSIAYRGLLQNAERILASATTIILHACSRPHEILARAGTAFIVEESSQISGEQETSQGSLRVKEVLNVHPNDVMQLPVGEAYVIAHGKAQRMRVVPMELHAQAQENHSALSGSPSPASSTTNQVPLVIPTTGPTEDDRTGSIEAGEPSKTIEDEQDDDLLQ